MPEGLLTTPEKTIVLRGKSAYDGTTQYRGNTAPNGTFSGHQAPSIVTNENGSVDLVLVFSFTQGTAPASNFLVFFNATGAASAATDAAYSIDARPTAGAQQHVVRIQGVNPSTHYSYAVAAYTTTASGRAVSALSYVASWQNFQPATVSNYTGNLDGTVASTVKSGAANGQTAFTDTAQYRNNTAPSNAATGLSVTLTEFVGQVALAQFEFSYTQGTNKATHFAFYLKYGGATIVASDPHFLVSAGAGTTVKMPFCFPNRGIWRCAVGAVAVCKDGPQYHATINQTSDRPDVTTNVMGFNDQAVHLLGDPLYLGDLASRLIHLVGDTLVAAKLDLNTNSGIFIPREVDYGASAPASGGPSMTAGEKIVMYATISGSRCRFDVHYDGTNKWYIGTASSNPTGQVIAGMDIF